MPMLRQFRMVLSMCSSSSGELLSSLSDNLEQLFLSVRQPEV